MKRFFLNTMYCIEMETNHFLTLNKKRTLMQFTQEFLYFGSGTKLKQFSNFFAVLITLCLEDILPEFLLVSPQLKNWIQAQGGQVQFKCVEDAWQFLKATDVATFAFYTPW